MDDLEVAHEALQQLEHVQLGAFNPQQEVSTTIISLLQKITTKFDAEDEFNQNLKEALLTRLPEAEWGQIASFLSQREMNENERLKHILAPFIPKDGDRVPLMDSDRKDSHPDTILFDKSNKENLQAVDALTRILIEYRKAKGKAEVKE